MLKVMTIMGTRPELIKMSRVIAELDKQVNHVLVHSGRRLERAQVGVALRAAPQDTGHQRARRGRIVEVGVKNQTGMDRLECLRPVQMDTEAAPQILRAKESLFRQAANYGTPSAINQQ